MLDLNFVRDNLALVEESQNRIEQARAHFREDLSLFRRLLQNDPGRYATDVARIEASLEELERKWPSR